MGITAYLVHRTSHSSKVDAITPEIRGLFGIDIVQRVVPTSNMIPFYREAIYIRRRLRDSDGDADALARNALAEAAARDDVSRLVGQVGICVVGRKLLGTTRLAWEALKHEPSLSSWIFVRWPENPRQYVELLQGLQQHRAKVVLWLDDLSKFRDDRNSSLIAHLPYDLDDKHIPFVVVATLPDDDTAKEAYVRFEGIARPS